MNKIIDYAFKAFCVIGITMSVIFAIKANNNSKAVIDRLNTIDHDRHGEIAHIDCELDKIHLAVKYMVIEDYISEETVAKAEMKIHKSYFVDTFGIKSVTTKSLGNY